jgi:hypothetical protein
VPNLIHLLYLSYNEYVVFLGGKAAGAWC